MTLEEFKSEIGHSDTSRWCIWSGKDYSARGPEDGKYYEEGITGFSRVLSNLIKRFGSGDYDSHDCGEEGMQISFHTKSKSNLCYTLYW